MKVGTDAILLGAWAPVAGMSRILDIGTGSGIISLMLAQRGGAHIDAIDIDPSAIDQAKINIAHSPWSQLVHGHAVALQDYHADPYDLLISNPPYFTPGQTLPSVERQWARHTEQLPHEQLLENTARLSHASSKLALVLPLDVAENVSRIAPTYHWHMSQACTIRPNDTKSANRQLVLFERTGPERIQKTDLTIRDPDGSYREQYTNLCRDFYFKM